jgi:ribosomal-protein-alanine N-acetyltransferase
MELDAGRCRIRPFGERDVRGLARAGDSLAVWRGVRDRFPHPYTEDAARKWLAVVDAMEVVSHFAIEVDRELVGGIGYTRRNDVERYSAEVGYWLAETHWGRGIGSAALAAFTAEVFATTDLERLDAVVFDWNVASCRVLEKCDYRLEGVLRRAAFKDGAFCDSRLYARLRSTPTR